MGIKFEKKIFFTILIILLGLEIINYFPNFRPLVSLVLILFFLFLLSNTLKIKIKDKVIFPIFILPIILLIEASVFLLLIPSNSLKHLFIIVFCFLLYLVIFSLNALKRHIIAYSTIIYNIITISYLVSVFFAFIIIYSAFLTYGLTVWLTIIIYAFSTLLFFIFMLWQNDLLNKFANIYILLLTLIMAEFFWVISFWPLLALSSGFILFIIYYIFSEIFIFLIKGILTKKIFLSRTTVPFFIVVYLLVSAKW